MRSDPVGWRSRKLADVCQRITSGGTPARNQEARFYSADGHPWVKTKELLDGFIDDTSEHITDEALEESSAKLLPSDTVLIAMYASPTVGRLGVLRKEAACNQACAALVVDPEKADYRFVFYALLHDRERMQQIASGSAQQNINARIVKEFDLMLPPLAKQARIAATLGSLDDKIESNRRLARLLEDTSASLFRARFIDFVGGNEFYESEMGLLPCGWRRGALTDLARFVNGKAFTKDANGHGRPILRIREMNSGIDDKTLCSDLMAPDESIARDGDILFAWSGSLGVRRWSGPESLINQHIFKVIPKGYPPWFVYEWICRHMTEFQAIASEKATTMGHIKREHLTHATVPIPCGEDIASGEVALGPIEAQRIALDVESTTLEALRDALLPKLVSGEIRVPDTSDPEEVIGPVAEGLAAATP
jgi:type I restriction enzyme, S subunit